VPSADCNQCARESFKASPAGRQHLETETGGYEAANIGMEAQDGIQEIRPGSPSLSLLSRALNFSQTLNPLVVLLSNTSSCSNQVTPIVIFSIYLFGTKISFAIDHRTLKTGLPVRSAVLKQCAGRLVVGWVTTSESLLLIVLLFCSFTP
jgi:hypothetical protein